MTGNAELELVTGFPDSALARRIVETLLANDDRRAVVCLVPKDDRARADEIRRSIPAPARERLWFLEGSPFGLDFGLSGAEWKNLATSVVRVHHASQVTAAGLGRDEAMRRNRGSTVEVFELARHAKKIERVVLWSSVSVSGSRRGFVLDDELELRFETRNPVEESLRRSEQIARAAVGDVPTTVLRPGVFVGDSRTGELDRREGMYLLIRLMLTAPRDRPMPMPARVDTPLPIVPVDYVAKAGVAISDDPRSVGRSYHLVDPDPLTAGRVFELLARSVGRDLPKTFLPPFLASRLMRLPGIQPGGSDPLPREFLDQLANEVVYDDLGARTLLAGTTIVCPPFESYVNALVRHVREAEVSPPSHSSSTSAEATTRA